MVASPVPLTIFQFIAVALIAYLLGGIPFTLLIGKVFYKIDPRKEGSGNLGATNSLRTLGIKAAIAVAILDVGKSVAAVLIAGALVPETATHPMLHHWAMVLAAICTILGHAFSPYIGFKGGKGVATAAGAILTLNPLIFFILLIVFLLVVSISRYVSLGSLSVAIAYPLVTIALEPSNIPHIVFAILAATLIIYLHRANIQRLRAGEESKLSYKKKETSSNDK